MRVLTLCELRQLLRGELESLRTQISVALPNLPGGSLDRRIAHINLDNIRRELTRRDMISGRWR